MHSLSSKSDSHTPSLASLWSKMGFNLCCLSDHLRGLRAGTVIISLFITNISQATETVQAYASVLDSELQKQIERENLRQNIDAQFEQLRLAEETGGAFDIQLGDDYFNYAQLLSEARYYDDANSAYQKALHIQKTNHGISSLQQLSALEGLFDNNFLIGNIKESEKLIVEIVRVEKSNPQLKDKPSSLIQTKMGHYYLERLKNTPTTSELAPVYLKLANKYFLAVIEQNKDRKLKGSLFPYGELAMTTYLGNYLERKPEKVFTNDFEPTALNLLNEIRGHSKVITTSELAPIEDLQYNQELNKFLPTTLSKLKYYFKKADEEGNVEEALKATLALGDLNYLSERPQLAKDYYAYAWAIAKLLSENHPARLALDQPAQLPDFKFAYNSVVNQDEFEDESSTEMLVMPLKFDVSKRGAINNIKPMIDIDRKLASRAKRELRKYSFRPAIKQGVLSDSQEVLSAVAVNTN